MGSLGISLLRVNHLLWGFFFYPRLKAYHLCIWGVAFREQMCRDLKPPGVCTFSYSSHTDLMSSDVCRRVPSEEMPRSSSCPRSGEGVRVWHRALQVIVCADGACLAIGGVTASLFSTWLRFIWTPPCARSLWLIPPYHLPPAAIKRQDYAQQPNFNQSQVP